MKDSKKQDISMKNYIKYILIVLGASILIIIVFDSVHSLGLEIPARTKDWLKWGSMFGKIMYFTGISSLVALNAIIWIGVIKFYQIIKTWTG